MMKNLIGALNNLATYMQMYKPQKPKNSEIRLMETNLELGPDTIKALAEAVEPHLVLTEDDGTRAEPPTLNPNFGS